MAEEKKYHYGGQAVIEGVMIRGRTAKVTAVRRPNGEITTDVKPLPSPSTSWVRRTPLIRGVVILIEAMVLGIQSLLQSANVAMEEEDVKISNKAIWGMMLVSALIVVALFFVAPLYLTNFMRTYLPNTIAFNLIEGLIRVVIFIGYIKLISCMSDIKRVFAYHGAEHKAVNAYEAGASMEVSAIKYFSRAHVRCGTSFLFVVMFIAIIVFSLVGVWDLWLMILSRIVLIPVIMALGYEFIYFGARHTNNWLMKIFLAPGLWLQSMTTAEPDDTQLEVAIAAMNKAVEVDQVASAAK